MEAVFEFLTSDVGVKAVIYVVGLLFGFVKGLKWIKDKKLVVAAQSLEAASATRKWALEKIRAVLESRGDERKF